MKLEIDITPILVNRTAVYRIALDLVRSWQQESNQERFESQLSMMGVSVSGTEIVGFKKWMLKRYFKFAVSRPILFLILRETLLNFLWRNKVKNCDKRRLVLDPLYTLMYPDRCLVSTFVVVHDLTTITHSDWHGSGVVTPYRAAFQKIAASPAKLICVSQSTADDLRFNFGISPQRIEVIPNYLPNLEESPLAGGQPNSVGTPNAQGKYLLFVGSLEIRKNVFGLIEGFARSGIANLGYELIIVGGDSNCGQEVKSLANRTAGVKVLGYVSDSQLASLYKNAAAFVYPSYWEGFGVPLLEAMAKGIPCLATETGASPEVGGSAVIYVDPVDVTSIARGIKEIAGLSVQTRAEMVRKGREQALKFGLSTYLERMADAVTSGLRAQL